MKAILASFWFIVISAAVFAKGWPEVLADQLKVPLAQSPKIEVKKEKDEVIVRVKNVSKERIHYAGSSSDSPQAFWEELRDGEWITAGWDFCGLGITNFTIGPQETAEFRFLRGFFEKNRRLFTIFHTDGRKRASIILLHEER